MAKVFYFLSTVFILTLGFKPEAFAYAPYGYTNDVENERGEKFEEIYLFAYEKPTQRNYHSLIWNQELSTEFKNRYLEKFGQVDTGSIKINTVRLDADKMNSTYMSDEKSIKERRRFAEFMVKRTSEWHVDTYIKEEPSMRPVYETKQALSHMEVKVNNEIKLNLEYSFSGNVLDILIINPWADSKIMYEMDPQAFGPAPAEETYLMIGKNVSKTFRVNTNYADRDGVGSIEFVKRLKTRMTGSIQYSNWIKGEGLTPRENKVSVGFGHSF